MIKIYDARIRQLKSGKWVAEGYVDTGWFSKSWQGFSGSYFWEVGTVGYGQHAVASEKLARTSYEVLLSSIGE